MWKFVKWDFEPNTKPIFRTSNETLCQVSIEPDTDSGRIAELNALDSACKKLADNLATGAIYGLGFFSAALSSLYSLYHGKKTFSGAEPEEQALLGDQKANEPAAVSVNSARRVAEDPEAGYYHSQIEGVVSNY